MKRGITSREIGFSDLPTSGYCKLIYTFSGWPEEFPCNISQASEVAEILLGEMIPRFGITEGFSSDKRPYFTTEMQELSKLFQFKWDLHTPWRLQSSAK